MVETKLKRSKKRTPKKSPRKVAKKPKFYAIAAGWARGIFLTSDGEG